MRHNRSAGAAATLCAIWSMIAFSNACCKLRTPSNRTSETDMGSHHVVVKPGSPFRSGISSISDHDTWHKYTCGSIRISIKNEGLIVNDKWYGMLKPNEAVVIDHGTVYVGGRKTEGRKLSDEEVTYGRVKETREELAGYSVTVRPSATSRYFGQHTLKVGDTAVSIKENRLFVNDKPYGALKTGDTIVVESGRVFVSGSERHPQ